MPQGFREPQALLQRHRPSTGHGNPAEVLCAEVPASNSVKDDKHEARTKTICIGGELQRLQNVPKYIQILQMQKEFKDVAANLTTLELK